ncbi:hypothetical protein ACJMK2_026752 [Sinanodonta woodiana]|uniref:G domain-containing protein n=1 Tax=Sinanodonta woodiana TaxID=1069815 RepID=A0ABD3XKJ7_SINWO
METGKSSGIPCQEESSKKKKRWRKYDGYKHWNEMAVSKIRSEVIAMIENLESTKEIKIILCGGTGEGISSLINNLCAAIRGTFAVVAQPSGYQQITKRYKVHHSTFEKDGQMRRLRLSFADTPGFSGCPGHGSSAAAIQACIMGKVANDEKIDPELTDSDWEQRVAVTTKASFIFFVANAIFVPDDGNIDRVQSRKRTYESFQRIKAFSYDEGITVAAFLTNCDTLDEAVYNNVKNLYYSEKVKKKVEAFSRMIDVPKLRTYPIVNYKDNSNVTDRMVMQALIPLKECLIDIVSSIVCAKGR